MKIYLLRHAEADSNLAGLLSHGSEGNLTERGIFQSQSIVQTLYEYDVDRIICSPYTRAIDTVLPFANKHNKDIEVESCLAEGQLILNESIGLEEPNYIKSTAGHMHPHEHETKGQFLSRVQSATSIIMSNKSSTILVVSHGHMIRELINNMLSLSTKIRFPHDNCGISCILVGQDTIVNFINRSASDSNN